MQNSYAKFFRGSGFLTNVVQHVRKSLALNSHLPPNRTHSPFSTSGSVFGDLSKNEENNPQSVKRGNRILCLDGGGIRGLIHTEILLELEKALGDGVQIRDCFDWIGGTSTGGILALGLSSGKSVKECKDLYWKMKDEVFRGSKPYKSEPLESLLKQEFGEQTKMADLPPNPKVIVTSVLADRLPEKLHLFRNYDPPITDDPEDTDNGQFPPTLKPRDQLVWEAARASGAAPTYFNPFDRFIDGGIMSNNPTLDVLAEVNEFNLANGITFQGPPVDVVLSLGTGNPIIKPSKPPYFYNPKSILTHPLEAVDDVEGFIRMVEFFQKKAMQTTRQTLKRSRNWCRMINAPYFRFSPSLEHEIVKLDCTEERVLQVMLELTASYLQQPEQQEAFQNLVQILKRK